MIASTEAFRRLEAGFEIVVNPYQQSIPGRIRTSNLRLRKPTIYPVDLRGHASVDSCEIQDVVQTRDVQVNINVPESAAAF